MLIIRYLLMPWVIIMPPYLEGHCCNSNWDMRVSNFVMLWRMSIFICYNWDNSCYCYSTLLYCNILYWSWCVLNGEKQRGWWATQNSLHACPSTYPQCTLPPFLTFLPHSPIKSILYGKHPDSFWTPSTAVISLFSALIKYNTCSFTFTAFFPCQNFPLN